MALRTPTLALADGQPRPYRSAQGRPAAAHGGRPAHSRWARCVPASLVALGLSLFVGCAGRESFLTGGPTVGQLKTSLSHLEYENQQLKRSVAKLERENRSIEDRLVQEQLDNGDLTARLDDARNLMREGGIDADTRLGARKDDDNRSQARTLPTSNSPRKKRKPPFAAIPGPVEIMPPVDADDSAARRRSGREPRPSSAADLDGDLNRQSYRTGTLRWLPVADSTDDSITQLR